MEKLKNFCVVRGVDCVGADSNGDCLSNVCLYPNTAFNQNKVEIKEQLKYNKKSFKMNKKEFEYRVYTKGMQIGSFYTLGDAELFINACDYKYCDEPSWEYTIKRVDNRITVHVPPKNIEG